ncbi:MAG: type IX secretion system sortase PorU [Bacteroidia bacterium]
MMMKKYLLSLFFLLFTAAYAQEQQEIALGWTGLLNVQSGKDVYKVPHFERKYMNYVPGVNTLMFESRFPVSGRLDNASLIVTDVVYEDVSRQELGSLNVNRLPAELKPVLNSVNARGQWSGILFLNPVIKQGSGFRRVKSFRFSYRLASVTERSVNAVTAVSNSVLSSGAWFRFYVTKSGVYRLSRSFLSSLGFDVNTDPRTIRIYGNGGRMVPMLNSTPYPMDLAENAIRFVGEEDGRFDGGDYILFYAEGVTGWSAENSTHNNLYADRSYYYVTAGSGQGKRIQPFTESAAAVSQQLSAFDAYEFHEEDRVNIGHIGRKWHGEAFNIENEQTFDFALTDADAAAQAKLTVRAAAISSSGSNMAVTVGGTALGTLVFQGLADLQEGFEDTAIGSFTPSNNSVSVKLAYTNGGVPSANAWLDFIAIDYKRRLRGTGSQYPFTYKTANAILGAIQYNFTEASSVAEVWDVTDVNNVTALANTTGATFSFKAVGGEVRNYVAVSDSDYYSPSRENNARVTNLNLKGTVLKNAQGQFQDVDYLIITPRFLSASAEKLADLHRTYSGLVVKVVVTEDIYQEFSSGKQDPGAIRNFVKYVYNNASSVSKRVKYVNLFGEASFDYKNRTRNNTNIVPAVQAISLTGSGINNYSLIQTFVTDDFYGAMDDNEGPMVVELNTYNYGLDIAVGRMLVTTVADADDMINKVKEYLSEDSYGRWRNEYIMLADDADRDSDDFTTTLENISASVGRYKNFINIRKVYMDSYVQQTSAGGQRYPDAKEQLMRYINTGALVVNYLGHGGTQGMSGERVFEFSDALSLTNQHKYPLFITATCELTKFDDPYIESTGEAIYKNVKGGAIAMITTTRAIYVSDANELNSALSGYMYSYFPQNTYEYPSMAEALRLTKANARLTSQFINVVSFIGDPALKLAIPKQRVVLTKINDVPVAQSTDVLKSLGYVKLSGQVTDESGAVAAGYNGDVEVTVFDKNVQRTTLNNDGQDMQRPFATLGETIFRGNATVTNGQFDVGFVVPRDIKVPVGAGRVSFYATRNAQLDDRTGYNAEIKVGGVNENAAADTTPPVATLYMNDENFVSGGITNDSPLLVAYLSDAHGINTASGIGHDIIGILDGDETKQYVMNDYYTADNNDYTRGTVRYPFINLAKGLHTLTFKAWDVYNNLVTAEIQFVVTGSDGIEIDKVLNYPNPFVSYTEFWFNHNRPYEPLDVQVQVFTITGKIVKTINRQVTTDGFLSRDIKWDGRDDFGDKIGKGVYIYKLTVRSTTTNKKAEKFEKLVLL